MGARLVDNMVSFTVNGVSFTFFTGELGKQAAELGCTEIPNTGLFIHLDGLTEKVLQAVGCTTFDWAKPQEWFDEYVREKGEVPLGVWWYPPRNHPTEGGHSLFGRFFSFEEMQERFFEEVTKKLAEMQAA